MNDYLNKNYLSIYYIYRITFSKLIILSVELIITIKFI